MNAKKSLVRLRRGIQSASVILLVYIVWNTRFPLTGFLNPEIFFKIDPLVMIMTAIAERIWLQGMLWALLTIAVTLLLGRAFCGWLCPLGALIDLSGSMRIFLRRKFPFLGGEQAPRRLRLAKYLFLGVLFLAALFGVQAAWLMDPITITMRALSFNIHPAMNSLLDGAFRKLLSLTDFWEPLDRLYNTAREGFLSDSLPKFPHTGVIFLIFAAILLLVLVRRRLWCRYLCPLGALLALPSFLSPLRRRVSDCRPGCSACRKICRMDAIKEDNTYDREECVLCLDCIASCANQKATFSFRAPEAAGDPPGEPPQGPVLTRARFIAIASSAAFASFPRPAWSAPVVPPLRPPGSLPEKKFVQRCIRCGNCIKVCPTNVLQPAHAVHGLSALWTPRLDPEIGYCEYECTLCGRVCPTAAIENLPLSRKKQFRIGTASIDQKVCLPWAKNENCIVCEEHCPIPDKAIRLKPGPGGLKLPYIVEDLCIGCGICTYKCPTRPVRAVTIRAGEIKRSR